MKHAGKARQAAFKMIGLSLLGLLLIIGAGYMFRSQGAWVAVLTTVLAFLWLLFAAFTFYFFRDPSANVPPGKELVVSPAHGTVDVIDEMTEPVFVGGPCKRISIFLNVFNVHVQQSPISGKVVYVKHTAGKFVNAMKTDSAAFNENVLIGLESLDRPGEKIGVRLIAGLIARRIIPWVTVGDEIAPGERISLIQFGSRVDIYLPRTATIKVKLGDKVVGGETVVATNA